MCEKQHVCWLSLAGDEARRQREARAVRDEDGAARRARRDAGAQREVRERERAALRRAQPHVVRCSVEQHDGKRGRWDAAVLSFPR